MILAKGQIRRRWLRGVATTKCGADIIVVGLRRQAIPFFTNATSWINK
jgi:hypothetical protein